MAGLSAWCRRRPDAVAVWALVLLALGTQARAFLPGRVLSPADALFTAFPWRALRPGSVAVNPVLTDVTFQIHPWLLHVAGEIGHGHFPLWNQSVFTGAPLFANPNSAVLFPLNALAYVLPIGLALALGAAVKVLVAGLGMYWLLRLLVVGPLGAFAGAAGFMLNGALVVWLQYPVGSAIALLPLLLALSEWLRQRPGGGPVVALGCAVALDVFAGYPPIALLGVLAAALWALARSPGAPGGPRFLLRWVAGIALGAALATVQLLPFLEYMRESAIYAYRLEWKPVLSLPPRTAIVFLMPHYYGGPADFWGPLNFNEITTSVGLLPWVALPAALVGGWRQPGTRFFALLGGLAAAILYGVPLLAPALAALPVVSLTISLRVAPLLILALSALGGLGVDAVVRRAGESSRALRWAVAAGLSVIALLALASVLDDYATSVRARMAVPLALQYLAFVALSTAMALLLLRGAGGGLAHSRWSLALILLQLASTLPLAAGYNPVMEARWLYPSTPAIEHLRRESARDPGRVLLQANLAMLYGLSDPSGYDGMTPRRLERLVRPGGGLTLLGNGSLTVADIWGSPVVDLLGVRRVLVPPGITVAGPGYALEYDGADARVYRNEGALPRAFLVPSARCVDDATALRLIAARRVDFSQEVLLAGCERAQAPGLPATQSRAVIRRDEPSRVTIEAAADAPSYLVLTDTWFPGWRASVDGSPEPVLRANHALRAVALQPGAHRVDFEYRPESFRVGLWVSLAAAATALGLVAAPRRRPRRQAALEGPQGPRQRAGEWAALGLVVAVLLGGGMLLTPPGPTLPPAPFDFVVSPSTVREGVPAALHVRYHGREGQRASGPVELYIASLQGWESALFLTPAGAWSDRPVPCRRAQGLAGLAPIESPWPWERKVGSLRLALIVVDAGADPRSRSHWLFQPTLLTLDLRAGLTAGLRGSGTMVTLAGLGLSCLAGSALALRLAARRPQGAKAPESEARTRK
ncbi:MAG: YfhO family protein [Candidatus Rokubacteria bacterium]|nr:YfhO family protein [Candidatus Rokubacteria bacterium]